MDYGPSIYVVISDQRDTGSKAQTSPSAGELPALPLKILEGPVQIREARKKARTTSGLNLPLLSLNSTAPGKSVAKFVDFQQGDSSCGDIRSTEMGGVKITSSAGDFAEWHELRSIPPAYSYHDYA